MTGYIHARLAPGLLPVPHGVLWDEVRAAKRARRSRYAASVVAPQ